MPRRLTLRQLAESLAPGSLTYRGYVVGAPSATATAIALFIGDGCAIQVGLGKVPDALLALPHGRGPGLVRRRAVLDDAPAQRHAAQRQVQDAAGVLEADVQRARQHGGEGRRPVAMHLRSD